MDKERYFVEQLDDHLEPIPILKETAHWWLTENGMVSKETGRSDGGYWVAKERIGESDWIADLSEKPDVDAIEFVEAFYAARALYGLGSTERTAEVVLPSGRVGEVERNDGPLALKAIRDVSADEPVDERPTAMVKIDHKSAKCVIERWQR